ncbi:MAG: glycosyltransferase family 2 protein [Candidatus Scalindua sp.]
MISINDKYPLVSIVIPTLNRKEDMVECLDSIQNLDYPKKKIELIIWDNGSTDGTSEAVKSKVNEMVHRGFSKIEIIKSPENLGPYIPYNKVGSKLSKESQYILGLDDDVVLDKDCLSKLVEVTRVNHRVGVVGGCIKYFDFPDKTILSGGWINWWLGRFVDLNTDKLTKCDYVIGCCWLIDRNIFNTVGGFDEDYFTMQWEMDFCSRVQKRGFNIYYQPEAIIKHKVPLGGKRTGLYYQYRNKLLLIKKNASPLQKLTSLTLYTLFWLPRIILQSLMVNKGINDKEIRIILKAAFHGIIGKTGKQEI